LEDKNIVRNFANRFKIALMAKTAIDEKQQRLARYAKALGHPIRVAIMNFLAEQDTCFFGEIHEILPIAKATASQHLKELKEAGLIQGEIMPPKVKYCINKENWMEAKALFGEFFGQCVCKNRQCCG
jgi:predicted transcriptional regulator